MSDPKDPKVVLAELKKLADQDEILLTSGDHAFIQTPLRRGFLDEVEFSFGEYVVSKYREEGAGL